MPVTLWCYSVAELCLTLWDRMGCSMPSFPVLHYLLGVCSDSCPLSRWCHPAVSSSVAPFFCPQSFPASESFSIDALRIRWPNYWSFSFSISPSNEYSESISFRIDWFDLLVVQGILKSLLQHHDLKASVLRCSAFVMVQLWHLYDSWKNHSFDYTDLCWQSDVFTF